MKPDEEIREDAALIAKRKELKDQLVTGTFKTLGACVCYQEYGEEEEKQDMFVKVEGSWQLGSWAVGQLGS